MSDTSKKRPYEPADKLRDELKRLKGKKYVLDCGHHVTIGHPLANDIIYRTSGRVVCSLCGYNGA